MRNLSSASEIKHRIAAREWRMLHPYSPTPEYKEKERERLRRYYAKKMADPEFRKKRVERSRKYRLENHEKCLDTYKKYYLKHIVDIIIKQAIYDAKKAIRNSQEKMEEFLAESETAS